ncbi:hypothetical protein [Kitasatospora griseola]|uniref:hypothetical protein n=1 Tax=Kitasatospora griseola TaxID=2064 RepID=UPI00166FB842|nr:hypothetical protein [Kitasatospora griseola]GGR03551.1 hypothetical protein GCM10010195_68970 [Kitasatospora griseola]
MQTTVRFTPAAIAAIGERAAAERLTTAGFIGNAALAAARCGDPLQHPDRDPRRPLVEALDRVAGELNAAVAAVRESQAGPGQEAALAVLPAVAERTYTVLEAVLEVS